MDMSFLAKGFDVPAFDVTVGQNRYNEAQAKKVAVEQAQENVKTTQAENALKQRQVAYNDWLTAHASDPTNVDTEGKIIPGRVVNAAHKAGFLNEGTQTAKQVLDAQAAEIKNAIDTQSKQHAAVNFGLSALGATANGASAFKDPKDATSYVIGMAQTLEAIAPGSSKAMLTSLLSKDANGNSVFDPRKAEAVRKSNVDLLPEQQFGLSKEGVQQAGAAGNVAPDDRDPSSAQSVAMRKALALRGIIVPETTSAAQIANNPTWARIVESNTIPANLKGDFITSAAKATAEYQKLITASTALEDFARKYKISDGTNIIEYIKNNLDKFQNNPEYREIQGIVADLQANYPSLDLNKGISATSGALRGLASNKFQEATTFNTNAKKQTFSGAEPAQPAQPAQGTPGAPQGAPVAPNAPTGMSPAPARSSRPGARYRAQDGRSYVKINNGPDTDKNNWRLAQ